MELPSFLQFAAFLKKKKGSPTADEKAKNGGPMPSSQSPPPGSRPRPSSSSSVGRPTGLKDSRPNTALNSSVGIGENAAGTSGTTIQNESLHSAICNKDTCYILSTRVKELEETLAGKEKDLNTLREELATCRDFSVDASTGMLSFGMEADYVTHIERFQKRLEEFADAVKDRDVLIDQLSEKLKSSNEVRAALQTKEEQLAQDVALLQKQLHHTKEIVEGHVWDTGIKPQDFISLQSQLLALEDTVTKNKSVINGLNAALQQRDMVLQAQTEELDKKSQELSQHKTKSAKEIQELMREVEELNQRSVLSTSADSQNLADLRAQLEEEFGLQLVQIKEEFRNQLDEKNKALLEAENTIAAQEHQLADTVTVFKSEILSYKQQVDALNVERQEAAVIVDRLTSELGSYNVDLALQKEQNQGINEKVKEMTERNERLSHELLTVQRCQQEELCNYNKQIEDLTLQLHQSKERFNQGEMLHTNWENPTEVHVVKCQLADIQEKQVKEISQLRQSFSKELESLRQRNESLEWELDNISRNKEKCTAELNACKEAYIAQWGSSKHAQDMEIVNLKEQITALKVQIQAVTSVQEMSENLYSKLEASTPLSVTEPNSEIESLRLQVKDGMLAQDSLSREITGHKLEIAMYKQEKEGLQQSLHEMSMLAESHRLAGLELQGEVDRCKQQVRDLTQNVENHSATISTLNEKYQSTISSKEQDIERLQALQDELSRVTDVLNASESEKESLSKRLKSSSKKYTEEMASYEEKLRSINLDVDNLTKSHLEMLSSYHEAQSSNTSLGDQIKTLECEVLFYKEQLNRAKVKAVEDLAESNLKLDKELKECKEAIEILHAQCKESAIVINTYIKELQFWDQQIMELNSQLAKESNLEFPNSEVNISSDTPVYEQLVINIKNNFMTLQHFIKSREESFHSATSQLEDSTLKLISVQSTLVSVSEENRQLHGNNTLAPAVGKELADMKQQLIESEKLLEAKTSLELALGKRVEALESELVQSSTNSASMEAALQEATVQLVAAGALSAAKDELEVGLKNRISELEEALHIVNEDSLSIRLESDQVAAKVATAKDLLERIRGENNELSTLCKLYEDDAIQLREQLLLSEDRVKSLQVKHGKEKLVEHVPIEEVCTLQNVPQLSAQALHSKVFSSSATHTVHESNKQQPDLGNLAFQIQLFEKYQEELLMRCNRYEEEVAQLREQLVTSENSLESLRQEVSNNRSSQSMDQNSLTPPNRQSNTSNAFSKRDVILSGGDCAPLNDYNMLGRGFDFGFNMSSQGLNNTEYMGTDDLKTNSALKLIENCSFLENVRNELVGNVHDLQVKLQEFELKERFYKEELELVGQRCKDFETKVTDLTKALEAVECNVVSQSPLETKILHLESENKVLQDMQANLHKELVTKQFVYEEKLSKMLHEQLCNCLESTQGATLEEMISDLGSKAKEVIILSEKLKSKEETETALKARLQMLEESYQRCITQLTYCKEEMFNVRKELEDSWQKQCQAENELARVRRELAIALLSKEQIEKSHNRLKDVSPSDNLESSKVSVLKQALEQQVSKNQSFMEQSARSHISTADDFTSSSYDLLDNHVTAIREKLQSVILKNGVLFADGTDGEENRCIKRDNHQTSLTAELSAYREQHATLAEVLGSTGVLQEALHRQKQELLQKTHEKAAIDELVERERTRLHEAVLKIETLQTELKQRDDVQKALNRQKYLLADELREIEEKLSERETALADERRSLEAEIRHRDLSIRQWRLKYQALQVERSTEQAVSRLTASPPPSPPRTLATQQLDQVKSELNAAHLQTLQRMRNHLSEQFSASERKLQTSHRAELLSVHEEHQRKLDAIQLELRDKIKELESLKQLEKQPEKHHFIDLDEWKSKLDKHQKEIYTEMQQQFEMYAQHKIEAAMMQLQDEHESIISSQKAVHEQEIQELQSKWDQQKEVELLGIKQSLTKQHNQELMEAEERIKAEISRYEDTTNPTDSKTAILLLKQLVCFEFTASFKALIDSRHETYRNEMTELISQLEEAMMKDDDTNQAEVPQLLDCQEKLLTQTEELLARVVTEHQCMLEGLEAALDAGHERLQAHLKRVSQETETATTTVALLDRIARLEEEKRELLQQHTASMDQLTTQHGAEVSRLQQLVSVSGIECGPCVLLRQELEAKHTAEMEELRLYFEKKCSELEKHYSEEVFSQHSRKLSSSSSCESELASDIYFTGGEQGHRVNTLTHMCDSYTLEPTYKELEEHYQRDYEKRIVEYREQLDTIKHSIEKKYCSEMETLKEGYDVKVEELVRELAANHSVEIKALEGKHAKDMENLRAQLEGEGARKKEDSEVDLRRSHLQDLEELKKTFEERLSVDLESLTDRMLQDEADHIRIVREEVQEKHEAEIARLLEEGKVGEHDRQLKEKHEGQLRELEEKHGGQLQELEEKHKGQLQELKEKHKGLLRELEEKHEGQLRELEEKREGQLRELEEKHQAALERERAATNEQVDQLTAMMKLGAEHDQEAFLLAQKEMMQGFLTKHQEDVKALKDHHDSQLRAAQEEVHKLQQEHTEYNEQIVQSKRRLHDEIQRDVLKALEDQLQVLLSEEVDEKCWPAELLQLQDKMAARYKRELATLHQDVERLRDELERVRSARDSLSEQSVCLEPVESVGLKHMAATLKCVVGEIVQYMSVCEEELNNTLVNQILKHDWENESAGGDAPSLFRDTPDDSSADLNVSDLSLHGLELSTPLDRPKIESYSLEGTLPRRVHFAPDMSTIFSMDEASLVEYIHNKHELSTEFRTELDTCLERLKAEAAALMGLSAAVPKQSAAMEERITALSRQLANELKAKEDLTAQLGELEALKEASVLQGEQVERLSADLRAARQRVTELESREDVTEGYGEQVSHNSLREGLSELQDQAQTTGGEGGVKSPHLHLIEELIREGDRLMEESKHEKDDLKLQVSFETSPSIAHMACCQQIAAADKQLRSTRQFLEQQALEREQERDEYLHEIENLRDQLKVTDKDRSSNYLRAKEADSLEAQMKEVSGNLQEAQARKDELEAELKAAIEKVWVLRDIITELESQVEIKSRHEATLRKQVEELESVLEQQNQTNQELMQQLDSGNGELAEHVAYLEEQLHLHRQQMEHLQPDSIQVRQMKTQLREFETTLDKKTKDLESLYTTTLSNTSCSSPSEDVSFREHIDVMRCATPDETPVSLPFDQLGRVQEKLNTHSRAEQATLKRIRDLEMQVKKLKSSEEEVMVERDVLQNQVDEQLLKISSIKAHLDEQRTKADDLVQQASVDLEARLHQREMEIRDLKEAVENRDKQVAVAQGLLEETRQAVVAQEAERSSRVNKERVVTQKLKREYNKLKAESVKRLQEEEYQKEGESEPTGDERDGALGKYIPISALIDAMTATKDAELQALARKVFELEQTLQAYMSLDLTDAQRAKLNNMLEEVKATMEELDASGSGSGFQGKEKTSQEKATELLYTRPTTGEEEYSSGAESDMDENDLRKLLLRKESQILSLQNQLAGQMSQSLTAMQTEMGNKDRRIAELEAKMTECAALEEEIKSLRDQLKEAIVGVAQDKEEVKNELNKLSTSETKLKADLAEREARVAEREAALVEKQRQIEALQKNVSQKDLALKSLSFDREKAVPSDDYDRLEMELEDERRSTKALKEELNQLRAENDRLQSELAVWQIKSGKGGADRPAGCAGLELELNDYMAKIQALQVENDALRSELEALKAVVGGDDAQLADELIKEKQARMYAERELRSALDKLDGMMASEDKMMEHSSPGSASCEEMVEYYKKKYEEEKQARGMMQGVLDSKGDELALGNEKHKAEQKSSLEFMAQATAEMDKLKAEVARLTTDVAMANAARENALGITGNGSQELDKLKSENGRLIGQLEGAIENEAGSNRTEIENLKTHHANQYKACQDKCNQQVGVLKAENDRLNSLIAGGAGGGGGGGAVNDVDSCKEELEKMKAENARLSSQVDNALKDAGGAAAAEIDNLKAQLASGGKSNQEEMDKLKAENARLTALADNALKNAGGAAAAEIDDLKAQLASGGKSNQEEMDKLKAENARLTALADNALKDGDGAAGIQQELEKLRAENAQLSSSDTAALLKQAQDEINKLKAEINSLNEQLTKSGVDKAEYDKLRNERDNLKSQLTSVDKVKSELDTMKADREKTKSQQGLADDEIAQLKAEIARLKAQLESVAADGGLNQQLSNEINQLKAELAKVSTERDNLNTRLESEKGAYEKAARLSQSNIQDVVKEGKDQITELQNRIKELEKENESLKKAIKDDGTFDDAAEKAEREKLEAIIKKLEGDISGLNTKMAEKENELKSVQGGKPDVVQNLTSSLEAEQRRNQDLQDELKRLRASIPGAVNADNAEIDKLKKKSANLEAQIDKQDEEKKGLVNNYEHKIAALTASYEDRLKKMNADSMAKLQASFEQFKNTLSPEDHLANVKKVENKYEDKLKTMEEQYEKRIKDMIASHNVEMDSQQQMYNKNLDDLRTTYDRDMKVLNDRHNNSVLKLQKMHESEVSEMNQEYEAEMKTMKNASMDTMQTLERQHNAEMEKLRKGHESSLNDVMKRHQGEKNDLTKKLDANLLEVRNAHKDEIDEWNTRYEKSFDQTKLENDTELQRLKDSNNTKIEVLKKQYEQLMEDERKKHQEQLNKMKGKEGLLTQSKTETYVLGEDNVGALAGQVKKELEISTDLDQKMIDRLDEATRGIGLACSPSLTLILNKVLQQGIDALTFDELSKLHQRTCAATSTMIMQNSAGRLPLEMVPTMPVEQGANRGMLCRRIVALEGEIKLRQEEAKQNMCHLESKIRNEEKRLHEMRQVLMEEQRRNIDLHSKLGNQNRRESELESEREVLKRQSTYQEERLQGFSLNLEREKNKCRCLEENLQKERNNTRHLQSLLEADRFRGRNANIKETDIIETMRIKLENALDNEAKIRIRNEKLEAQLRRHQQMQPSTCPAPCNPANRQYTNDMQSLLDAEVEKCGNLELALKREQLQVEQLQVQLDRERRQAIEMLETERDKRDKLRRQISSVEEEKQNLNVQLDTARENLCSQRLIAESLERKLEAMQEIEVGKQRRRDEDDEKNRKLMEKQRIIQFDLEQRVLDLQRQVADLNDQISAGGDAPKLSDLRQQLSESLQREQQYIRDLMTKQPADVGLSASLLQKLKSMNSLLETHVEENASVMAAMNRINQERQHLQDKVRLLETQLANKSRSRNLDNETEIVNGILAAERSTWAREKAGLEQALFQAEGRASRVGGENISKDDQARHLFGKYLRVESYRKALIWQKRYLLVVLSGYQEAEAKTVKRLSRIARANDAAVEMSSEALSSSKHKAVNRFKSCGLVVIAIHRMHYMVRRWRHSRQLGSTILFNRGSTESIPSSTQSSYFNGPRRKGSASSCWSVPRSLSHADVPRESRLSHSLAHSMSRDHHHRGSSSPTTERYNAPTREQHMLRRWEADHVQQLARRSESVPETSPVHITEYINRFDKLQQTLSLNIAHIPTTEKKLSSQMRHPPNSS